MLANTTRAPFVLLPLSGLVFCACLFIVLFFATRPATAEPAAQATPFAARFLALDTPAVPGDAKPGDMNKKSFKAAAEEGPRPLQMPPSSDDRPAYRALLETEARQRGLAPEIAEAVMAVESGYNPGAVGGVGEIGLMQILPSTARMLGFGGSLSELAVPATNIRYGVMYLAEAWRLAGGDLCTAVMKYRAGHGETRFSYRSVDYCVAVRSKLIARGFPVTGSVPVATFGEAGGGGGGGGYRKCVGRARIGNVNLATLNTQLSTLVLQARGGH
jgi:soluble lytic murein transglycosylase-like protein